MIVWIEDVRIHEQEFAAVIYPDDRYEGYTHRVIVLDKEDLILLGQRLYFGYVIRVPSHAKVCVKSQLVSSHNIKRIGDYVYLIRPNIKCLVDVY